MTEVRKCLKKFYKGIIFVLLVLLYSYPWKGIPSQLYGNQGTSEANAIPQPYIYNPLIPLEVWQELEPYFLPPDHPIKMRLDRLFQKHRITLSLATFIKSGFLNAKLRKPTNVVVGKNPRFYGYVFKVYLDTQPQLCEWDNWLKRIQGANAIRKCIDQHGFDSFTVPQKWLYPLPLEPFPPLHARYNRKNFILICEDMNILTADENLKAYKKKTNPRLLWELYTILTEVGLLDSVYPDNIPFTIGGQIAFIDTEHHHHPKETIPYHKLTPYLSEEMEIYWQSLINRSN